MKNIYFPDEQVTWDDLKFVCYMIERIARRQKQPNCYVVHQIGRDELASRLSLASVQHCENPLDVEDQWIAEYHIGEGTRDVLCVNPELVPVPPTALQMGKVYARLIEATRLSTEDYPDGILRVYDNPICETLDDYNCGAYYEPSYFIARAYHLGDFM